MYAEGKSFEQIADEFRALASDFPRLPLLKFLAAAQADKLFELPTAPLKHKPYALNAVYLNMTDRCNLRCICCFAEERRESGLMLKFADYKKILDEVAGMNAAANLCLAR